MQFEVFAEWESFQNFGFWEDLNLVGPCYGCPYLTLKMVISKTCPYLTLKMVIHTFHIFTYSHIEPKRE